MVLGKIKILLAGPPVVPAWSRVRTYISLQPCCKQDLSCSWSLLSWVSSCFPPPHHPAVVKASTHFYSAQGCKKVFFRSKHKISYWKIAPATAKIRSIFGGFWPISTVTWLELVLLIKSETDLTEFAYKWPHMFRKLMPILKNRSGWGKLAPSNARVLTDFLHPWRHRLDGKAKKGEGFMSFMIE